MSYKTRAKSCYGVTICQSNLKLIKNNLKMIKGNELFVFTVLTFLVVVTIYFATMDWKGFTAPEEVDLGVVTVPTHGCRRKHRHHEH